MITEELVNIAVTLLSGVLSTVVIYAANMARQYMKNNIAIATTHALEKATLRAIEATEQTYVQKVKENNGDWKLTKEQQVEAKNKAVEAALAEIGPASRDILKEVYADLDKVIANMIEAHIRQQNDIANEEATISLYDLVK